MATTATDSAISGDSRRDAWWVEPAVSVGVLLLFIAYSNWRAFENNFFSAPEHLAELYRSGGVAHLVSPFRTST